MQAILMFSLKTLLRYICISFSTKHFQNHLSLKYFSSNDIHDIICICRNFREKNRGKLFKKFEFFVLRAP